MERVEIKKEIMRELLRRKTLGKDAKEIYCLINDTVKRLQALSPNDHNFMDLCERFVVLIEEMKEMFDNKFGEYWK